MCVLRVRPQLVRGTSLQMSSTDTNVSSVYTENCEISLLKKPQWRAGYTDRYWSSSGKTNSKWRGVPEAALHSSSWEKVSWKYAANL